MNTSREEEIINNLINRGITPEQRLSELLSVRQANSAPLEQSESVSSRIFQWLGVYRDKLPPEAVTRLQEIADSTKDMSEPKSTPVIIRDGKVGAGSQSAEKRADMISAHIDHLVAKARKEAIEDVIDSIPKEAWMNGEGTTIQNYIKGKFL